MCCNTETYYSGCGGYFYLSFPCCGTPASHNCGGKRPKKTFNEGKCESCLGPKKTPEESEPQEWKDVKEKNPGYFSHVKNWEEIFGEIRQEDEEWQKQLDLEKSIRERSGQEGIVVQIASGVGAWNEKRKTKENQKGQEMNRQKQGEGEKLLGFWRKH
ncbi:hypothetical protein GLAREA_11127 [Glarea lozoyensis ATCC 20868]|uniref:Uncharacterized protein n=1 Tax=Glarea lozoyensis (strain ATCC 20868 / MF5171) TaxID=1116229 RepID=S3EAS4_GLAL2|nr:uncharacterized protein GLAREA_11127 [Glarea lozoyensis ATCC 20868]EPE35428.1 hypothetical protein GLAREA_11127 [Glarea lozoyensis ATCC 20868]